MTPYPVVTSWTTNAFTTPRQVIVTTDTPLTLILTYSLQYPALTPRYKTLRGKRHECGFYLKWQNFHCAPQLEPGPSTTHTFETTELPDIEWGYCCAAESCHPLPSQFATIPMPLPRAPFAYVQNQANYPFTIPPLGTQTLTSISRVSEFHWPPTPYPFTSFQQLPFPQTSVNIAIGATLNTGPDLTAHIYNTATSQTIPLQEQLIPHPTYDQIFYILLDTQVPLGPWELRIDNNSLTTPTTIDNYAFTPQYVWLVVMETDPPLPDLT